MANWLQRAWHSIMTDPGRWADARFEGGTGPGRRGPGLPNLNIGAGPVITNWDRWWPRQDEYAALGHPALWRCVHLIAGAIGSMPIHAYRGLERIEPASRLLTEPSPTRPRSAIWHQMAYSLLMHGNAIAILSEPDRLGWPQRLRPIHPLRVYAYDVDGEIEQYAYTPRNGNGNGGPDWSGQNGQPQARILDPSEVLHIWGLTVPGEPFGIGVLEAMQGALGLADYLRQHAKSWFEGAGIPSGILQLANPNPSQEVVDDAKRAWMERHGGSQKEPAVLPGDVEWKPVAQPPEASQLLQSRQYSNLEIALMFGVPAHMIEAEQGGTNITYQNVETEAVNFVKWGLLYWLTQMEEALTRQIPGVQYTRFNLDGLLRTDTLNRYRAHQIAAEAGFLTTNEIRELEGRGPREEEPLPVTPQPGQQPQPAAQPPEEEEPELAEVQAGEGGRNGRH